MVDFTPDLTCVKFEKILSKNEVSRLPLLCGQTIDCQTVSFGRIKNVITDDVELTPDSTHVKFQKNSSKNEVSRPLQLCGQTMDRQTVSFGQIKNVIDRWCRSYPRLNSCQISEDFVKNEVSRPLKHRKRTEYRAQSTEYRVRLTMTIAYDLRSKLIMKTQPKRMPIICLNTHSLTLNVFFKDPSC